jgi:hypothetical protein
VHLDRLAAGRGSGLAGGRHLVEPDAAHAGRRPLGRGDVGVPLLPGANRGVRDARGCTRSDSRRWWSHGCRSTRGAWRAGLRLLLQLLHPRRLHGRRLRRRWLDDPPLRRRRLARRGMRRGARRRRRRVVRGVLAQRRMGAARHPDRYANSGQEETPHPFPAFWHGYRYPQISRRCQRGY